MYHSITFGDKNTWDDWHLVPSTRPLFNPPVQKVKTLDIPGGDGLIDLSTSLTGYPVYQNRTGSIEFLVMNGYKTWDNTYSDVMNYLHGRTMKAILEDDPDYYYEGRFTVNSWKSEKNWSKITIDYSVGPYKWAIHDSLDSNWLWDPFSFVDGVIRSGIFGNIEIPMDPSNPVNLYFSSTDTDLAPVKPKFMVTGQSIVLTMTDTDGLVLPTVELQGSSEDEEQLLYQVVDGLILFGGTWYMDRQPVIITAHTKTDTVSDTTVLAIHFRPGRL